MAGERLLCTFFVGDQLLGLDISVVQEVLRRQEITRLPLAAPAVRGIINLRGRLVPALSLRRCLGIAASAGDTDSATIVVRSGDSRAVSFLVDEIGDVIPVEESLFERTPETMQGVARELVHGVFPLQDRLLLELDLGRVLQVAYA